VLHIEALAVEAWQAAVGPKIARHTRALALHQDRLVVEVGDEVWQRQLSTLRKPLLGRLAEVLGRVVVRDIEFRVAVPKMPPRRAEPQPADEADGIQDPVLRTIFRASRTKARA
jgi:predicted nucleic acid-binding Zn ribbon protein